MNSLMARWPSRQSECPEVAHPDAEAGLSVELLPECFAFLGRHIERFLGSAVWMNQVGVVCIARRSRRSELDLPISSLLILELWSGAAQFGRRWKTVRCFTCLAISGIAWMAVAPVPMMPTRLPVKSTGVAASVLDGRSALGSVNARDHRHRVGGEDADGVTRNCALACRPLSRVTVQILTASSQCADLTCCGTPCRAGDRTYPRRNSGTRACRAGARSAPSSPTPA